MLFWEMIAAYYENHMKPINKPQAKCRDINS